uniref:Mutant prune n=1 Tax=Drosophila melanogaster TaxID=7227 RepID=Q24465_DROME|nr:mutant prune [Drosophila melanogaster]AAK07881.1 mutant prune [Drosophila melanogaster]CAA78127.1 prune [Drosophila melanogaster]
MCFLRFLAQARGTLGRHLAEASPVAWAAAPDVSGRKLHLVMGNESCDLDSAVSAVTLAFVYAASSGARLCTYTEHSSPGLPVENRGGPLVCEMWDCRARVALPRRYSPGSGPGCERYSRGPPCKPWAPNVTEILDHRPLEDSSPSFKQLPTLCQLDIDASVGSCATLVAQRYLAEDQPRSTSVAQLLHATIVLDTINFAPAAKRYGPKDEAMVQKLESELNRKDAQRSSLFDELVAARADISKLTLTEVLRKDMKVLQTDRQVVPLAGMPILVRDFVEKSGAEKAVREFGVESNLLVILGMYVSPADGQVQRDLALISLSGQGQFVQRVQQALMESNDPKLELRPHEVDTRFMGGCFLRQHNVQATRKHILPIVKRALLEWEADHACDCDEVYFFKEKPQLGLS